MKHTFGALRVEQHPFEYGLEPLPSQLLNGEIGFYQDYRWCVNAHPTVGKVIEHLHQELGRLNQVPADWRRAEVMINIFLLSCALSDSVDDYLLGEVYDFSKVAQTLPGTTPLIKMAGTVLSVSKKMRALRLNGLRKWRQSWKSAVDQFLQGFVGGGGQERNAPSDLGALLAPLLEARLPRDLQTRVSKIPAAFRSQDFTHFDCLRLGQKLMRALAEDKRPLLVIGLRTAGSYFAPLLSAYLKNKGYRDVDSVTIRPKKGIASWELAQVGLCARRNSIAVIIDEPPSTGSTATGAADLLRKAGFSGKDIIALLPVHPTQRDWKSLFDSLAHIGIRVLRLEPEESYKHQLYEPETTECRLQEYFLARKYLSCRLVESAAAKQFNSDLQSVSEEGFHSRLKRIYQVQLRTDDGDIENRYVLAKSVGWGWLGYHAFFAADRLSQFLPPVLGLRDGILYTEWRLGARGNAITKQNRQQVLNTLVSYVGTRASTMRLEQDPSAALTWNNEHKGSRELANLLSKAYGPNVLAVLKHGRIRRELSRHAHSCPTLTDSRMRGLEWIMEGSSLLKTDFEHHGMGKHRLNTTDPTYDLAEAFLHWGFSEEEQREFTRRYVEISGDIDIEQRLFLNKLLAGSQAMAGAWEKLKNPRLAHRTQEFNQEYLKAWRFLTLETMRFCARFCQRPLVPRRGTPLIVLDIDGVLDKQIFGFPCTTAAGIKALSLLHAHDFPIVVNTARSVSEVKEYCRSYGFVGGVAEYGSFIWDAEHSQGCVLLSPEALSQLKELNSALCQIPGVFLDDCYRYSIRAYTYEHGKMVPLSSLIVQNLMASLKLDLLSFHQTYTDTTIVAREIDKGKGLLALLALLGQSGAETLAIGDSASDLAMFRVAKRCFAPGQIGCHKEAKSLGCQIASRSYQPGLLQIVRSVVHPSKGRCERCRSSDDASPTGNDLFFRLLEVADQNVPARLLRTMFDPMVLQAFRR